MNIASFIIKKFEITLNNKYLILNFIKKIFAEIRNQNLYNKSQN